MSTHLVTRNSTFFCAAPCGLRITELNGAGELWKVGCPSGSHIYHFQFMMDMKAPRNLCISSPEAPHALWDPGSCATQQLVWGTADGETVNNFFLSLFSWLLHDLNPC